MKWHTLPYSGGTEDQEYGLLDRMEWAQWIYETYLSIGASKNYVQWTVDHPKEFELFTWVEAQRKNADRTD
jgi:hypothetical protein